MFLIITNHSVSFWSSYFISGFFWRLFDFEVTLLFAPLSLFFKAYLSLSFSLSSFTPYPYKISQTLIYDRLISTLCFRTGYTLATYFMIFSLPKFDSLLLWLKLKLMDIWLLEGNYSCSSSFTAPKLLCHYMLLIKVLASLNF